MNIFFEFRRQENCFNSRRKSGQIVCTGNENVFYTAIPQTVKHGCPIFCALVLAAPHSKHVFWAVKIDSDSDVYGFFTICPSQRTFSPLRSRGTDTLTSPKLMCRVLLLWPFRLLSVVFKKFCYVSVRLTFWIGYNVAAIHLHKKSLDVKTTRKSLFQPFLTRRIGIFLI